MRSAHRLRAKCIKRLCKAAGFDKVADGSVGGQTVNFMAFERMAIAEIRHRIEEVLWLQKKKASPSMERWLRH